MSDKEGSEIDWEEGAIQGGRGKVSGVRDFRNSYSEYV